MMDLSKAFDCIPHEFMIAKLHAYGFEIKCLELVHSYLKGRNQRVKINMSTVHGNKYSVEYLRVPCWDLCCLICF